MMLHDQIAEIFREDPAVSDVHLTATEPLWIRRAGNMQQVNELPIMDEELRLLVKRIANVADPETTLDARGGGYDFGGSVGPVNVRCNLFLSGNGRLSMVMRRLRADIPTFADLGLPDSVRRQTERSKGILLVTGPTGSGKSTTLAACVGHINRTRPAHILTIEDPVEYVIRSERSKVTTRQIGVDVPDFLSALRSAMREDPDTIMIGELRDPETMRAALAAADTGHLVMATLHTVNAYQTVQRVTSFFGGAEKEWARNVFANVLNCVISQVLVRRADGKSVTLAYEVMFNNPAVRQLVVEDKIKQIENVMRQGRQDGHVLLNFSLAAKVKSGEIRRDEAIAASYSPDELEREL